MEELHWWALDISGAMKLIKYVNKPLFGHRAMYTYRLWDFSSLFLSGQFHHTTNAIESINRSLKQFIGMGQLSHKKLESDMHGFHTEKFTEYFNKVVANRMSKIRRKTILREVNLKDKMEWFEGLSED